MADPTTPSVEAADPATSPERLAAIAAEHPDLQVTVAGNPSAYPGLLDWLAQYGDEDVRAAVAARTAGETPATAAVPAARRVSLRTLLFAAGGVIVAAALVVTGIVVVRNVTGGSSTGPIAPLADIVDKPRFVAWSDAPFDHVSTDSVVPLGTLHNGDGLFYWGRGGSTSSGDHFLTLFNVGTRTVIWNKPFADYTTLVLVDSGESDTGPFVLSDFDNTDAKVSGTGGHLFSMDPQTGRILSKSKKAVGFAVSGPIDVDSLHYDTDANPSSTPGSIVTLSGSTVAMYSTSDLSHPKWSARASVPAKSRSIDLFGDEVRVGKTMYAVANGARTTWASSATPSSDTLYQASDGNIVGYVIPNSQTDDTISSMFGVSPTSGIMWRRTLGARRVPIGLQDGVLTYFDTSTKLLHAVDLKTGHDRWTSAAKYTPDLDSFGVVGGSVGLLPISGNSTSWTGIDLTSGKKLYSLRVSKSDGDSPDEVVAQSANYFYFDQIDSNDDALAAVNIRSGATAWTIPGSELPVSDGGDLDYYVIDGQLLAVELNPESDTSTNRVWSVTP